MIRNKKYDVSGSTEAQFEPESDEQVLKNLLGITKKREMDRKEAQEQLRALDDIAKLFVEDHRFTAEDISRIHKIWLGKIYSWTGQYRQVNISKGSFPFAAAAHIPELMKEFEKETLQRFTPCSGYSTAQTVEALAVVHTELVLIHPFREGNGRMARLLSILMGWQAKLPTLDFGGITGQKKEEYFAAVRAGMARDYKPMQKVFSSVLKRTLKNTSAK